MKTSRIKGSLLIVGAVIIMTCSQAFAEIAPEPLALQKIMRDMGENMQVIADDISREDWKLIEKTAPLIADHPQPPMGEKVKIIAFVGADVSKFKGYDGKTHEAARVLGESAVREDGYAIIADFAKLQNTCLIAYTADHEH